MGAANSEDLSFDYRTKDGRTLHLVARPMSPAMKMFSHLRATQFRHGGSDPDCTTCTRIRWEIARDLGLHTPPLYNTANTTAERAAK
jgi:hypothetical protein